MTPAPRSIVLGAAVAAVVAAVAAGLFILGSPAQERERRIDDRRAADLHAIAAAADLYRSRHSRLPASLDELAAEPGMRINTRDPATEQAYGYQVLDSARYEVCATFDRESVAGPREPTTLSPVVEASCRACHGVASVAASVDDDPGGAHSRLRDLWAHGKGRECFRMRAGGGEG
ncbi:MAG: hypothetical protein OXQ94_07135 [Gemmatimonadota bacterium]|nr:hypothetical protein [Gemmatimonadota bacterium]MDE2871449.1 hypothetical protein [Gemmatimonadota bacterium]